MSKIGAEIKNIGPITDAKIDIDNITVLYGLPGAGKSYTLRSLFSVTRFLNAEIDKDFINYFMEDINKVYNINEKIGKEEKNSIKAIISISYILNEKSISNDEIINIIIKTISERYNVNVTYNDGTFNIPLRLNFNININDNIKQIINKYDKIWYSSVVSYEENKTSVRIDNFDNIIDNFSIDDVESEFKLKGSSPVNISLEPFYLSIRGSIKSITSIQIINSLRSISIKLKDNLTVMERSTNKSTFNIKVDASIDITTKYDNSFISISRNMHKNEKTDIKDITALLDKLDRTYENYIDFQNTLYNYLIKGYVNKKFENYLNTTINIFINNIKNKLGVSDSIFIPYGRSVLINNTALDIRPGLYHNRRNEMATLINSYLAYYRTGVSNLKQNHLNGDITTFFKIFINGDISINNLGQLIYSDAKNHVKVDINMASAMVQEVSGLLLPINAIDGKSLIFIEEPETQLHIQAQFLMGLLIIALAKLGHKIIITTHSSYIINSIYLMQYFEPSIDDMKLFLKYIFNIKKLNDYHNKFAEMLIKNIKNFNVSFNYLAGNRSIKKINMDEIGNEIKSMTDFDDLVANWAIKINNKTE